MRTHKFLVALGVSATLGILPCLTGCGGVLYAVSSVGAESKLETAEALGAERYAPYEYWYAREHLMKAKEEAASADYGDAIDYADTAQEYADKAITLAKQAHEGAGR